MIGENLLGRYECVDPSTNTNKFWWLTYDRTTQVYTAYWGRIGTSPKETIYEGDKKAFAKVKEKLGKGYFKVEGNWKTVEGSNAANFIMSIFEGEENAG